MGDNLFKVYRNEYKYYVSIPEYYYLKSLMGSILTPDPNMGDKGEYFIRSLYFDSADNLDYKTKMAGIKDRKKIRLRVYDTETDKVKLEIKNRDGAYMLKESLVISRPDADRIIGGDYKVLEAYDADVARKARTVLEQGCYSPKVIVDYEREAFVYPEHNVRITFDKNLRAISCGFDRMFDKEIPMIPIIREPIVILELKYDQMLPSFIKDAISTGRILNSSVSKYCMARELLM